ncbi:hypothetical protein JCM10908_007076 [Rhodotorula pacifica]|uniref:uncharacterized protein n=1 Tax=Rhodotorula pacifica TaxID=1495444 RepID=UPI00317C18A8
MSRRRSSVATAEALGLTGSTSYVCLAALFTHALLTVAFLVFINAASPFVITSLPRRLPPDAIGSATSRLLLADELTALSLYLPVGALVDSAEWGLKRCAIAGYGIAAVALVAYTRAPGLRWLIVARIVFAVGGSTLVTTMSALLLNMSAVPDPDSSRDTTTATSPPCADEQTETSRLLNNPRRGSTSSTVSAKSFSKSSRSAGILAFAGGTGAVIAVFGFLRLPTVLARFSPEADASSPAALRFGLQTTFHLLAALAILQAIFLACALPPSASSNPESRDGRPFKVAVREVGNKLVEGFRLGAKDGNIALGYASSFASRAQTTVTNAFLPLLIERYFSKYHLCDTPPDSLLPPRVDRDSCRRAYILASALTGIVQLLSLVLSPLVGYLASSPTTSRLTRHPHAALLGSASLVGVVAFVGYSTLPRDGDPRSGLTWVYASGVGVAQAAGVVLSLALVTTGRGRIVAADSARRAEIAGTLSGAYGFSGGLGILFVGASAGFLFDKWPGAPFALMGVIDLLVAISATVLYRRS